MRLRGLDTEYRWQHRLKMRLMRLMSGRAVPDVVKMHYYRYELFGGELGAMFHEAMRGPSEWAVGEREAMAAFVSSLNQCVF
jgi:hypothetical protein